MKQKVITVVSGLPRSGTSMMMTMLQAGGLPILTDKIRKTDKDNPKGYFEFEKVKQIKRDHSWLKKAQGRVVKIISEFLKYLPKNYDYKIIFMRRDTEEILASQRQMIKRRKTKDLISDKKMAILFRKHLKEIETWLSKQPNIETIYVSYNEVLKNPAEQVNRIIRFLNETLNTQAMVDAIDPKLYRQKR